MTPEMVVEVQESLLSKQDDEPLGAGLEKPLDDIPDPPVPHTVAQALHEQKTLRESLPEHFGEHEALLQGFCQHLQTRLTQFLLEEHTGVLKNLDVLAHAMRTWGETVSQQNEHAQYSLSDSLMKLQEHGLVLVDSPYQARLQVRTPGGYPLTLTVTRATSGALIEELGRLEPWLQTHGYAPASQ